MAIDKSPIIKHVVVNIASVFGITSLKPHTEEMERIFNYVSQLKDDIVVLDFKGVELNKGLTDDNKFKQLLIGDEFKYRVYIQMYNAQQLYYVARLIMITSSIPVAEADARLKHEIITSNVKTSFSSMLRKTPKNLAVTELLLNNGVEVEYHNNRVVIHYYRHNNRVIMSNLQNIDHVASLYFAIEEATKKYNLKKVLVDFGTLSVLEKRSSATADLLTRAKLNLEAEGLTVDFQFKDEVSKREWEMSDNLLTTGRHKATALKDVNNFLKVNTVGMLAIYVSGKKKDRLGRDGKGEVAERHPAIFLGINGDMLRFKVFDGKTFKRRVEWDSEVRAEIAEAAEYDREPTCGYSPVFELKSHEVTYHISEIGIGKICTGSKAHFSVPVVNETHSLVKIRAWNIKRMQWEVVDILHPYFLKLVLIENAVTYNRPELDMHLDMSYKNFERANIELPDITQYDFRKRDNV